MKAVLIISSLTRGGAEKNLSLIANHLATAGHIVRIFTFDNGSVVPAFPLDQSIEHRALSLATHGYRGLNKIKRMLKIPFVLRRRILNENPDVVLTFMDETNILCLLGLLGTKVKVVAAERVNPAFGSWLENVHSPFWRWCRNEIRNLLYRTASRIAVQTPDAKKYFPQYLQKKLISVPNPVSPPKIEDRCDLKLQTPCILAMGRLVRQKRFDILLRAFGLLHEQYPQWHLSIVGAGPEKEKLSKLIQELKLEQFVHLPGSSKTPLAVMQQSQIFCLSSDYEGFPGVLCEAMSLGLPVVATDCDYGPREIIRPEVDGLLVEPGQPEALSKALEGLIKSEKSRADLASKAKEITTRFNAKKILLEWENWLKEVNYR